jgi:potassium channel subfamily K protein 9
MYTGYGHSTPNTISGKLFTMFYAIIGIPLGLVMFQSIGERLNKFSSVVIQNVKQLLNCRDIEVKPRDKRAGAFYFALRSGPT